LACEECDEQRARRLALEQELRALEETWADLDPVNKFIERKVYTPMPQKLVVLKPGPVVYVDRWSSRSAGFFGRLGDKIDRVFGGKP
jgi:hypothetical protein